MCGIAGYCLNPKDTHINARRLAQSLLLGIEMRGRDATGAAWRNRQGHLVTQKRDVTAAKFVPGLSVDKRSSLAILHTRMWTQGKPENPLNNHPITAGDIIGVHNGTVSNDRELLRKAATVYGYEQQGEVDSEAIFATIDRVGYDDESFDLMKALEAVEAKMALAWLDLTDDHDNTLHLVRGDGSPLVIGQTANGSLIFASTEDAILDAAKACGFAVPYLEDVKEGTYFRVRDGIIAEQQTFTPTPNWYYSGRSSATYGTYPTGTGTSNYSTNKTPQPQLCLEHTTTYLEMKYLDPDTEVPEMTTSTFKTMNPARHKAVSEWLEKNAWVEEDEGLDETHAVFAHAARNGAFLRPGMWVQTPFKGEWHDAQVYKVPKTFPKGDYILRVLIPYVEFDGETYYEPILLARSVEDMDGPALTWDATPAVESTTVSIAGELNSAS